MGLQHVTDLLRKSSKLVLFFILGHMVPLEVMPGKRVGMSYVCYPNSLIGNIPNVYYYAANNPSEATIVKRWSYANIISYLTPPAENAAGLYKGLQQLKELISSYQSLKDTGRNQIVNSIISTAKQCNLDPHGIPDEGEQIPAKEPCGWKIVFQGHSD